jgi:N-carbamoylputrescine amidase
MFQLGMAGLMLLAGLVSDKPKAEDRMAGDTVRVAICQTLCIDSDREGNLQRIGRAMELAAKDKPQLACFPETAILGWVNPAAHKLADPIPGPTTKRLAELAKKHKVMIAIGLCEKEGDKLYDSAILMDIDGAILLKHRKMNTLVELLDPPYTRGHPEDIAAVDTRIGRVGMLICADTFDKKLLQRAADCQPELMIVPYGWAAEVSAWPDHGKNLATTVSNAAKAVGCAVVGTDLVGCISAGPWKGKTYGGQSVASDCDGKVLTVLADRDVDVKVIDVPVGRVAPLN